MKKNLFLSIFAAIAVCMSIQAKKKTSSLEKVTSNTHISQHPMFDFLKESNAKKIVVYLSPVLQSKPEGLRTYMLASNLTNEEVRVSKKDKYFLDPFSIKNDHLLTPENYEKYKAHGIVVFKKDCASYWNSVAIGSKLSDTDRTKVLGGAYSPFMLLSSDSKQDIMIYKWQPSIWSKLFTAFSQRPLFATFHRGRIAILIDENRKIVHILDDVKSEDDIFTAFGIK